MYPAAVLLAALAAGALTHRVLLRLAAGDDHETLARALPGPLGEAVSRLAGAPLLTAVFVALVPLLAWVVCGVAAPAPQVNVARAQRGLALAWIASLCASVAALVAGMTAAKQGMAALGYALAWPALASLAVLLWASRLPRFTVVSLVTVGTLAGLVVRALPVGWPGENSLSWWAMLPGMPRAQVMLALLAVGCAVAAAAFAASRHARHGTFVRLALLTLVSALLLRALPAFEHYGFDKHAAALASEINTSYFQVAGEIGERDAFVRGYAARMGTLPMHARTHPPGWPLLFRAALDAGAQPPGMQVARRAARLLGADWAASARLASSVAERPLADADVAGLWLVVALLAFCVVALPAATYFMARAFAAPDVAMHAAAWTAFLGAPLLFFPDVDVAHPALFALAVGAWLRRDRHVAWALVAGVIAAALVWLSFGNLAIYLACGALVMLGWRGVAVRHAREAWCVLGLLLPLALLAAWAEQAGAGLLTTYAEAMRQHHLILAHRTRLLWLWLNPLETAVALGVPSGLWIASHVDWPALWAGARRAALEGGRLLLAATLFALVVLDLSGQTKGESGRLWMGFFPLLLAGAAPTLAARDRDWPGLAVLLAMTLVVMKGFYVFVWLYQLR